MNNTTPSPPAGVEGVALKTCTRCKAQKPLHGFHVASKERSGRASACRSCCSAYHKSVYAADPEKARAKQDPVAARLRAAKWYAENRERALAASKLKRQERAASKPPKAATPVEVLEARAARKKECKAAHARKWYLENREATIQRSKNRVVIDRSKTAEACANRRARGRSVPWKDRSEISKVYREARRLTRETGVIHEVDHVYPIMGKKVSGLHVHQNLQALPGPKNRAKANKLPGYLAHELWDPQSPEVFHD